MADGERLEPNGDLTVVRDAEGAGGNAPLVAGALETAAGYPDRG